MAPRVAAWLRRWICLGLVGLGLVVAALLLARTFALLQAARPDAFDVCALVFGAGCDAALAGPGAWMFGIPLAGWGVVYYGTLLGLLVLAWTLGPAFEREAHLAALLLSLAGAAASCVLITQAVLASSPPCPLCYVANGINLLLPLAIKGLTGRRLVELWGALRAAARYLRGAPGEADRQASWKVVGLITAALLALVLYQWVLVEAERRLATADRLAAAVSEFALAPQQAVAVDASDPQLGPHDADLQLVVFGSFQCPGCRELAEHARQLVDRFEDRLVVVYKHFPLAADCNPHVAVDVHPHACGAARAAIAAQQQGKFWAFHDALLAAGPAATQERVTQAARAAGLDLAQFEQHRGSPATAAKLAADVELGAGLGVTATPAVYLDGRRIRRLQARELAATVEFALEMSASEPLRK